MDRSVATTCARLPRRDNRPKCRLPHRRRASFGFVRRRRRTVALRWISVSGGCPHTARSPISPLLSPRWQPWIRPRYPEAVADGLCHARRSPGRETRRRTGVITEKRRPRQAKLGTFARVRTIARLTRSARCREERSVGRKRTGAFFGRRAFALRKGPWGRKMRQSPLRPVTGWLPPTPTTSPAARASSR